MDLFSDFKDGKITHFHSLRQIFFLLKMKNNLLDQFL